MCLFHLYKTKPAAQLTAISQGFLFLVGVNVEKDTENVGKCVDTYLHNYAGDALGTDALSVRVIGGLPLYFLDTRQALFISCGQFGLSFPLLLDAILSHRLRFP